MKAIAIYAACEQVGEGTFRDVYETREVELPDDFLEPDGIKALKFIGLSFENGQDKQEKEAK